MSDAYLPPNGDNPFDEIADELLKLGARERDVHMLRAARIGGQEGQVELGLEDG